jgi:hypothetical protein
MLVCKYNVYPAKLEGLAGHPAVPRPAGRWPVSVVGKVLKTKLRQRYRNDVRTRA